jgi:hypothetical protein
VFGRRHDQVDVHISTCDGAQFLDTEETLAHFLGWLVIFGTAPYRNPTAPAQHSRRTGHAAIAAYRDVGLLAAFGGIAHIDRRFAKQLRLYEYRPGSL